MISKQPKDPQSQNCREDILFKAKHLLAKKEAQFLWPFNNFLKTVAILHIDAF